MTQQAARLALRAFILISVFLTFVYLAVSLADDSLLPKELAEWKAAQETEDDAAAIIALVLGLPVLITLIASLVGLFMFKKWAAWLYLALSAFFTLFILTEPTVESGLSAFVSDLGSCLGGVILGIAFFSKALEPDEVTY